MDDQLLPAQKRRQNLISLGGMIIAVVFPFVLSIGFRYTSLTSIDRIFYSRFIFWAEVLLLMLYAAKAEKRKLLIWDEQKRDLGFFVLSVIALYLLNYVCGVISLVPRLFGYHENSVLMKKVILLMANKQWLIFFTCFTAGVTEELIFRGYIMTRLSLLFKNNYMPIILSALAFSALHYGYKSLRELIFAFLIGILFGTYYQRYRNIKVLIAAHFMVDIINVELLTHFYKLIK